MTRPARVFAAAAVCVTVGEARGAAGGAAEEGVGRSARAGWRRVLAPALAAVLAGCAGGGAAGDDGRPRSNRNTITAAEVAEATTVGNAYLLVERLRPLWLRKRGPRSILFDPGIIVYEGTMRFGDAESLRYIPTIDVESLRFLPPDRAMLIHGAGHPHGAIVVEVKSGPDEV
ncbi:hypothetical protein RQM47_00270 [Rubrivirga sp. S365]|uniref:Uncharacterized protein n=1 Tax=Rubrivirga litoralis TaxID=3075598 RepID=A0ABU3BP46_9BACT|nr:MULTISPECIES: hypothetical protein [unclassified Rubrivirga]MDT0631044.1 hypothetical protein [Rubrivirga sp. F394]MDT7855070.1 hypothetical protein [Rubrivirga sp. S365]